MHTPPSPLILTKDNRYVIAQYGQWDGYLWWGDHVT